MAYLAEFADITNLLALEGAEVGGDATVFQVDNTSEGLIKKRSNGKNREVASFRLFENQSHIQLPTIFRSLPQAYGS